MKRMILDTARVEQHLPQQGGGRRDLSHPQRRLHRLDRGQMMGNRADAADFAGNQGHLPNQPPLDELFKAPELKDLKPGFFHPALAVEIDGDLAVAFNPADRVYRNLGHLTSSPP